MYRSCVVCVLVADFDVEEIMEGFTMESITNRQIIEYYSKQPALSSKYVLTNKYTEYRRNAEKLVGQFNQHISYIMFLKILTMGKNLEVSIQPFIWTCIKIMNGLQN